MEKLRNILIQTTPYEAQPYCTLGFYEQDRFGTRLINITDTSNSDYIFLVALHEMIEQHLIYKKGITDQECTDFDIAWEEKNGNSPDKEPGDDENCPYREEHDWAIKIEKTMAMKMGIDWDDYENFLTNFIENKEREKVERLIKKEND